MTLFLGLYVHLKSIVCQLHTVLATIALKHVFKLSSLMPPVFHLLFSIALAIWGFFFMMVVNFRIVFNYSDKE